MLDPSSIPLHATMFSWGKSSDSKKKPKRRAPSGGPALNAFGIPINQQSGNDEELEAELRALTGGVISLEEDLELNEEGSDVEAEFEKMFGQTKSKKVMKKTGKGNAANFEDNADVSVDVGVTDVPDDIEDKDLDVDENDPELLGELLELAEANEESEAEEEEEDESEGKEQKKEEVTIISVLRERLNMYTAAESKAKENNESSRARRFSRGIKTLQQLIKKAEAGQPVLPSEIPPVIATNLKPAPPPVPVSHVNSEQIDETPTIEVTKEITEPENDAPVGEISNLALEEKTQETDNARDEVSPGRTMKPSPPVVENPWIPTLRSRRDEYKASALAAKRNNDLETALKHVKCVKQLNALLASAEMGKEINESEIPPSLSQPSPRKRVETVTPLKFEAPDEFEDYEIPKTVLEALNQRLRIYQDFQREAEMKGDETGMERNGKIAQLYAEAIKLHKSGRRVSLGKLPTPPGCPPIPIPFELD